MTDKAIILDSGIAKILHRVMSTGDPEMRLELARAFNVRAMHAEALEQSRRLIGDDPANGDAWLEATRSTFHLSEESIPELRELFGEAGFRDVHVLWESTNLKTGRGNGIYRRITRGHDDTAYIAYIVGRA